MQKSTKRLLSVLAVLALVLTMAPAGILAVETKAAAGDANRPEGVAELMAAGQAKQAAAVAALEQLTGATIDERCAELKAILPVCPFCGKTVAAWLATNGSTQYGGTGTPQHFYVYGTITKAFDTWDMTRDGSSACILFDEGAVINTTGRIKMMQPNNTGNIGGKGTFSTSLSSATTGVVGLFHMLAANGTVNLYGGNVLSTCEATYNRPIVYMAMATSTVNIWTDDVVIGHETPVTTNRFNIRQNGGVLNIYGGTIIRMYNITIL